MKSGALLFVILVYVTGIQGLASGVPKVLIPDLKSFVARMKAAAEEAIRKQEMAMIEKCELDMKQCPFTVEVLMEKLTKHSEFFEGALSSEEIPTGALEPEHIPDFGTGSKIDLSGIDLSGIARPGISGNAGGIGIASTNTGTSNVVRNVCTQFCVKVKATGAYKVPCRNMAIPAQYRYWYMSKCYTCRRDCERVVYI